MTDTPYGRISDAYNRYVRFQQYKGLSQDDKGIPRGQGPGIAWFTDPRR